MERALFSNTYKLKKSANKEDFYAAFRSLREEFVSKQSGFISWQLMVDGDVYSDVIVFETMKDLEDFEVASKEPNPLATAFYSYLNVNSCRTNRFDLVDVLT